MLMVTELGKQQPKVQVGVSSFLYSREYSKVFILNAFVVHKGYPPRRAQSNHQNTFRNIPEPPRIGTWCQCLMCTIETSHIIPRSASQPRPLANMAPGAWFAETEHPNQHQSRSGIRQTWRDASGILLDPSIAHPGYPKLCWFRQHQSPQPTAFL